MPPAIAAVLPSSERKRPPAAPRSQPFCGEIHFVRALRGERSCPASMVKSSACPFDTLAREARGTDIRASAERLRFTCERSAPKGQGAQPGAPAPEGVEL